VRPLHAAALLLVPGHVERRVAEAGGRGHAQADFGVVAKLVLHGHDENEGQIGDEVGEDADKRGQVGFGEEGADAEGEHDGGEGESAQRDEEQAEVGEREEAAVLEDARD